MLEATQQPGADHREVLDRLDLYKRSDAFNNHLAHVFAFGTEFTELVRPTVLFSAVGESSHHQSFVFSVSSTAISTSM